MNLASNINVISLYYFTLCPFSRKIYILLQELGLQVRLIDKNPWKLEVEFARINHAMNLPVLIDGKKIIAENYPITEYLCDISDYRLMGDNIEDRSEIRRVMHWFDHKFYIEVSRYIINDTIRCIVEHGTNPPNSKNIAAAQHNLKTHIEYIEFLLRKQTWLAGEKITVADITAFSHISVLDYCKKIDWRKVPNSVKNWMSLLKSRPSANNVLHQTIPNIIPPEYYKNVDM